MKHRESRTVGAICLGLAILFLVLGDYLLSVPLAVYGILCFVLPEKLFATREQLDAVRKRRKDKSGKRPITLPWYQSPVIVGIVIASVIFGYYALA